MITKPWHGITGRGMGQFPRLNYPWIAHGVGVMALENMETGFLKTWISETIRYQAGDWISKDELLYYIGESNASIRKLNISTMEDVEVVENINISRLEASNGNWVVGFASPQGGLWRNGRNIDPTVKGWRVNTDGLYSVVPTNDGLHIYKGDTYQRTVAFKTTCEDTYTNQGYSGYGYNGPAYLVKLDDGSTIDVTVTPWKSESAPLFSDGWVWTVSEHPSPMILGRPLGDELVIKLDAPFPTRFTVNLVGNDWVVASQTSDGQLMAQSVSKDFARVKLEPIVITPPPVVYPSIPTLPNLEGRQLWFGYFKCISDQYGDNLTAPGNCVILETQREADRCLVPFFAPVGVGDNNPLKICSWTGPGNVPCDGLHYIDNPKDFGLPLDGVRWLGLEAYASIDESVGVVENRFVQFLEAYPNCKVIIIGQAYDRNGTELNNQKLMDLQVLPLWLAAKYDNIEGILEFSDGRKGGTRDHEWWREVHTKAAKMVLMGKPFKLPPPAPPVEPPVIIEPPVVVEPPPPIVVPPVTPKPSKGWLSKVFPCFG